MDLTPLVSVGLFVYNGERFMEETLNSILNQTFTDFELIISDNASTDRTGEISQAYARRDRRIRYYRSEKNMGAGWNVRRVYELATGKCPQHERVALVTVQAPTSECYRHNVYFDLGNDPPTAENPTIVKSETLRLPKKRTKNLAGEFALLRDTRVDTDKTGRKVLVNEIRVTSR